MARRRIGDSERSAPEPQVEQKSPDQAPGTTYVTGAPMNPAADIEINVADLQAEFRGFSSKLYSYREVKSEAEKFHDLVKLQCDELEAETYLRLKNGPEKVTEKNLEALIATDEKVKAKRREVISVRRDFETSKNFVESLNAKKDMLIQLGADARKEA